MQTPANVKALATDHPPESEVSAQFQRDGHRLLRRVALKEEMAAYRPVVLEAREEYGAEATSIGQRDTYGKAFRNGLNLRREEEGLQRCVGARRFATLAADLPGVDGVRVYHDRALFKEASGELTLEVGSRPCVSVSHRTGCLGDLPISDEREARFEQFIHVREYTKIPRAAMAAGDATFHYGWTLHGARGNVSDRTREVMTIIWYPDGSRVGPLDNENCRRDRDRWLPGLEPGDLAASELNLLVFQRP
jgi:hypothetical protein